MAFQVRGIPVPEGDTAKDLERLERILVQVGAVELIIARDLFHCADGGTPETVDLLGRFLGRVGLPVFLAVGNHDRGIRDFSERITRAETLEREGVNIVHDPGDAPDQAILTIAGHLHPSIWLRPSRGNSIRAACFWLHRDTLILPSFGGFTGGQEIIPVQGDRVFVSVERAVREIPDTVWIKP